MDMKKVVMTTEDYDNQIAELKRKIASAEYTPSLHYLNPSDLIGNLPPFDCISQYWRSPSTMPKETATYLYVDEQVRAVSHNKTEVVKNVRVATYKDGRRKYDIDLIPAIEDVQVLNDRVIMVKFSDGTTEKAVLDESDTFSVEQGIAICLTKKLLSILTRGNGGSVYNKLVEYGVKTYEAIEAHKAEVAKEKTEKAAKAKRDAEKAQRKKERKAAEQREADIEIQKEAYLRAMRELNADK